ncbi:MAG: CapA family protein [Gemmatimonadota bacterium]|nr:MAG: CapA family protein [Gemmatimonadota bacterium]
MSAITRVVLAAAVVIVMSGVASCGGRAVDETLPAAPPPADTAAPETVLWGDTLIPPDTADVVQQEPEPEPEPEPAPPPPPVRVCAGGDVVLGSNVDTAWATRASSRLGRPVPARPDPDRLLAPLAPLVADADVVLINVEGAIGEGPAPRKCRPGSTSCYAFRQPVAVAGALGRFAEGAAIIGNLANNHSLDAGGAGFAATQEHLRTAGVAVTGVDTLATVVVTNRGDSVAFLGFSTAQAGPDPRDLEAVSRHVERAAQRFPRVVVTMHMGAEGASAQRTANVTETYLGENRGNSVAFARAAVDAGASVVIGHGPHVMRASEWWGDALVLYSLGNLLTYGPFSMREPNSRGAVACVTLNEHGDVLDAALRSTYQRPPGVVAPDPTGRAAWLVDSLSQLDFPATAARWGGEARVVRP